MAFRATETMLADLRALAARVCWCKCMGYTAKIMVAVLLVVLSQWCNPCTCTNIPVQPVRVNLPIWFLPTFRGPADCNHCSCYQILFSESSIFQSILVHGLKQCVVSILSRHDPGGRGVLQGQRRALFLS